MSHRASPQATTAGITFSPAPTFERADLSHEQLETLASNKTDNADKSYILEQFNIKPLPRNAIHRE